LAAAPLPVPTLLPTRGAPFAWAADAAKIKNEPKNVEKMILKLGIIMPHDLPRNRGLVNSGFFAVDRVWLPSYREYMKCPFCGHNEDRVLDTREQKDGGAIRRRRECLQCKSRFSTVESLSLVFPYIVKKDGRREPYNREKVLKGVQAACQKRPIGLTQIEALVDRVSTWLINRGDKETPARHIGQRVMRELRLLDDVAYVRFASVYRTFKDLQEFVETLEDQEILDVATTESQLPLNLAKNESTI
jgi:transcriptional repressor NrdR